MLTAAVSTTSTYAGGFKSTGSSTELFAIKLSAPLVVSACFVYNPRLAWEDGDDDGVSGNTTLALG